MAKFENNKKKIYIYLYMYIYIYSLYLSISNIKEFLIQVVCSFNTTKFRFVDNFFKELEKKIR